MEEYNPEAPVRIEFSNTTIELFKDRTAAYTFRELGHRAINHLWLTETDEDGETYGQYIWFNQFGTNDEERDENFTAALQAMLNYDYTLHLNLPAPSDFDIDSYIEYETRDL